MRISPEYRELNLQLHRSNPDYGRAAHAIAPLVVHLARETKVQTILDYGCGKGTLRPAILALAPELVVTEYDPAMPGKDSEPSPVDVAVCIDVLEHIEPDCLDDVLSHIQTLGQGGAFFIVDTVLAQKTLADGRNAHLIVEGAEWWRSTLSQYFNILAAEPIAPEMPERILVVGVPLPPQ